MLDFLKVLLFLAILFFGTRLFRSIFYKVKHQNRVTIIFAVTVFIGFCGGASLVAYVMWFFKSLKEKQKIYDEIRSYPSVEALEKLQQNIQDWGVINEPKYWNELRGAWYMLNESSYIPTQRKVEFRNFLTTEGLYLSGRDRDVIDNYSG